MTNAGTKVNEKAPFVNYFNPPHFETEMPDHFNAHPDAELFFNLCFVGEGYERKVLHQMKIDVRSISHVHHSGTIFFNWYSGQLQPEEDVTQEDVELAIEMAKKFKSVVNVSTLSLQRQMNPQFNAENVNKDFEGCKKMGIKPFFARIYPEVVK